MFIKNWRNSSQKYQRLFVNPYHFLFENLNKYNSPTEGVSKIACRNANSVDHDKAPRSAASNLCLHCLLRSVCPNTIILLDSSYFSTSVKRTNYI